MASAVPPHPSLGFIRRLLFSYTDSIQDGDIFNVLILGSSGDIVRDPQIR
jgi:hypothetical protein